VSRRPAGLRSFDEDLVKNIHWRVLILRRSVLGERFVDVPIRQRGSVPRHS
jgi:hypothetical protein